MTNKQMLSVERELLERLLSHDFAEDCQECGIGYSDAWGELRALLDKPEEKVEVVQADNAEQALTLLDFALSFALCNMDHGGTRRDVKKAQAHLEAYRKFKAIQQRGEPVAELQVAFFEHGPMATINWFTPSAFESGATKLYAEQPAPVDKYRCEQVPFSMLCYGAKFKYTPGESAVFVKIGPDLVAGWDGQKVADGWIGQPVCSFSDDGNLLAAVTLVHDQAEPVASESACTSCDGSGEYTDAIGDWRGYCTCPAGVEAEGIKGLMP